MMPTDSSSEEHHEEKPKNKTLQPDKKIIADKITSSELPNSSKTDEHNVSKTQYDSNDAKL